MMILRLLLLAASVSTLAACAVGPTYHPPFDPPAALLDADPSQLSATTPDPKWWRAFADPKLDALIETAMVANLDLRQAVARVDQARALFTDAKLDRLPRVTSDAAYQRSREQIPGFVSTPTSVEQADIGFDASWEIDLFGRVRHEVASARADRDAARADLRNVRISIAAEVARNYLELRGAQARRKVAEDNADTERETLRLTTVRRTIGYSDPVDVESAKARFAATQASIPPLIAAEKRAAQRLAVLTGQRPGALDAQLTPVLADQPARATTLAVGDLSDFLRRRPDVQAAERRLAAETDRTGVATADLFPRIRVTGFIGLLSGDVSTLFKTGSAAWAVSPTVTWPALDLGGARARLRAQQAKGDAALAAYQEAALNAVEDLQDSLTTYKQRQAQVVSLAEQVVAARRAADLSRKRYKEGDIDFLRVLDAERTRLDAEDALTLAQTNANTDVVAIYKALGGAQST